MKIYLKQSIKGIGRAGEVRDFPDGYAQNFIIKKGYGVVANNETLKQVANKKVQDEVKIKNIEAQTSQAFAKVNNQNISIKVQANEYGNLFSSIHKKEVLIQILNISGPGITEKMILDFEPIKKIGEYKIHLKHEKLKAEVNLTIKH